MKTENTQVPTWPNERKVFPLHKLAASIASQIASVYSGTYWITAEISKLNYYPQSGHCYPQLVEKKDGKIIAEIRAFILRQRFQEIDRKFKDTTGTSLGDGMQVMFSCKVSYHPVFGLQLNLMDAEPYYTLGEMARMRQEAMARLKLEGLFGRNKVLATPLLVRKLAVISVETSKGWRDFAQVMASSKYPNAVSTRIFSALLQGDAAVQSIITALDKVRRVHEEFDAVAIIRGGGGEVGLDCYDSYLLGKEICTFPIPVITGIGHATNLTLVEQVAHKNLITPTDLARYIADGFDRYAQRILSAKRSIGLMRKGWFALQENKLDRLKSTLINAGQQRNEYEKKRLNTKARSLGSVTNIAMGQAQITISYRLQGKLREACLAMNKAETERLRILGSKLGSMATEHMKDQRTLLAICQEKVKLLDPIHTLKRGFSITTHHGRIVTSTNRLKTDDTLETVFAEGRILSRVIKDEK